MGQWYSSAGQGDRWPEWNTWDQHSKKTEPSPQMHHGTHKAPQIKVMGKFNGLF